MATKGSHLERILDQYIASDDRGFLLLTASRQVLQMNAAARGLLQTDSPLPAAFGELVRAVNVGFALGDAIHDRRIVHHEAVLPDPDRILRFQILPILTEDGYVERVVVSIEDVSRLRHLETVRRDFVANVSHELRTPIASINLLVDTLQTRRIADPDDAAHFLRRIAVETGSMNQLVEELLELSKLESGRLSLNLRAVDLPSIVDRVAGRLAMMAEEREVAFKVDVQPDLPPVMADAGALEQVLMNLVHNGLKFTPSGGEVAIRARRHGPGIQVHVVDTGVGIDPVDAGRVFERFYKADKGRHRGNGTGLGLAIARHVLDLHGSRLTVVSEPGHGSRFAFDLPIAG